MNSDQEPPPGHTFRAILLGGGLLAAAVGGALVMRLLSPSRHVSEQRQARPIVQIIREQPGLPDLADLIDQLCPSIAVIVPHGSEVPIPSGSAAFPAFLFSDDGWLVTSGANLPESQLDAVFSDGRRVDLSDVRVDPVSGLAIVKAADTAILPLPFGDQTFPRVGQFGFSLTTPAGAGCAANAAMIGSDFLADGGGPVGYVRLQPAPDGWSVGTPLLANDGRVIGIGTQDPPGAVIPAPIASVILDELIRNNLSPSTSFGFRAIDFAAPFSIRLGNVRSGAGVALVQLNSAAARAGLQAGDIVTAVDRVPVSSASELSRALDALPDKATLTVQRLTQQRQLTIKRTAR